jgi:hypothetical protein
LNPDYAGHRPNSHQPAIVAAGCRLRYAAVKIGYVILKMLPGLAGFALLGDAIWWFLSGMNH